MVREVGGTEDPRVTLIGDTLYMTYTAYGDMIQLAMAKIKVEDFLKGIKEVNSYEGWNRLWVRNGPVFKVLDDKDAVLFPVEEHKVRQYQISSRKGRNEFVTLFPELLEGKFALIIVFLRICRYFIPRRSKILVPVSVKPSLCQGLVCGMVKK